MSIIDFHTHAFPDSLAARAIAHLEAESSDWKAVLDGRVSSLIASMDAAGIAKSVVCPIATKPDHFAGILDWCLQIRSGRIVPLGSVHPEANDVAGQIAQVARAELIGIKMHPMYQGFAVDDDNADRVFRAAAEQGLLVALHCGQDIAYPDSDQADPIRIARVVDKYPDLRLVATHLGGWKSWDSVRKNLLGKPVYMETSFAIGWMSDDQAVEIIRAQGVENVFFGTDSPWADQKTEIENLRRLPLTDDEKDMILVRNADKILNCL